MVAINTTIHETAQLCAEAVGYPNADLRIVYLGTGDMRHLLELIQYVNPPGQQVALVERNAIGTTHLGIIVGDPGSLPQGTKRHGGEFVNPPAFRDASYSWARRACCFRDLNGNWLEFTERVPTLPGANQG